MRTLVVTLFCSLLLLLAVSLAPPTASTAPAVQVAGDGTDPMPLCHGGKDVKGNKCPTQIADGGPIPLCTPHDKKCICDNFDICETATVQEAGLGEGIIWFVVIVASFVAGAKYGRSEEAKAIALAIRIESYGKQEFVAVISKIKAIENSALVRLKKLL